MNFRIFFEVFEKNPKIALIELRISFEFFLIIDEIAFDLVIPKLQKISKILNIYYTK